MTNESLPDLLKQVWQNQGKEHSSMSVEQVRLRAHAVQRNIHRNLVITMVFGVVLLVFSALAIERVPYTSPRVITVALMVLISIVIYRAYRMFWSPGRLPPDAAVSACLDFYRRELAAQYEAVRFRWWQSLPDFLLLFFIIRIAIVGTFRYETLRIILPALFGLLLFARYRKARKLRAELDALDAFEKEKN